MVYLALSLVLMVVFLVLLGVASQVFAFRVFDAVFLLFEVAFLVFAFRVFEVAFLVFLEALQTVEFFLLLHLF